MVNRLGTEPSPYLRQHASNPVHWLPWGEEAFERARLESKPIFLSVGYATCHWCHVMAHESFADPAVAKVLNREFVSIKVDREERPDIDRVYMAFVQATTGSGGWPLSVWLTPALEPFYGGTYFPPASAWGRPSFLDVAGEIARAWREDRADVTASAARAVARLREASQAATTTTVLPDAAALDAGVQGWARVFDEQRGGFGNGPKFPRPSELLFLLREYARTGQAQPRVMALGTLRAMAMGGMRDHVGGGFHRYSVDGAWRVPHFEKMLYDQALLVVACLEAAQVSGDAYFAQVAEDTLRYVERDLVSPDGGFYSAEDADSVPAVQAGRPDAHPTEGAFYIWSRDEIVEALGPDSRAWELRFGVLPAGNAPPDSQQEFGRHNLLYTARTIAAVAAETGLDPAEAGQALARGRQRLFAVRERRPRPLLDDKVLASWNGLMIAACARAARVLGSEGALGEGIPATGRRHLLAAQKAAAFVRGRLWDPPTGRLLRRVVGTQAGIDGFAEDFAYLAWGVLELFQADGDPEWLAWAIELQASLDRLFEAPDGAGWFATTGQDPSVLVRQVDEHDGAEPAASSVAVSNLLMLARLTGKASYQAKAERVLAAWGDRLRRQPRAAPHMLAAMSVALQSPVEIVLTTGSRGEDAAALMGTIARRYLPTAVTVPVVPRHASVLAAVAPWAAHFSGDRQAPAAYVCRDFVCQQPATTAHAVLAALDAVAQAPSSAQAASVAGRPREGAASESP